MPGPRRGRLHETEDAENLNEPQTFDKSDLDSIVLSTEKAATSTMDSSDSASAEALATRRSRRLRGLRATAPADCSNTSAQESEEMVGNGASHPPSQNDGSDSNPPNLSGISNTEGGNGGVSTRRRKSIVPLLSRTSSSTSSIHETTDDSTHSKNVSASTCSDTVMSMKEAVLSLGSSGRSRRTPLATLNDSVVNALPHDTITPSSSTHPLNRGCDVVSVKPSDSGSAGTPSGDVSTAHNGASKVSVISTRSRGMMAIGCPADDVTLTNTELMQHDKQMVLKGGARGRLGVKRTAQAAQANATTTATVPSSTSSSLPPSSATLFDQDQCLATTQSQTSTVHHNQADVLATSDTRTPSPSSGDVVAIVCDPCTIEPSSSTSPSNPYSLSTDATSTATSATKPAPRTSRSRRGEAKYTSATPSCTSIPSSSAVLTSSCSPPASRSTSTPSPTNTSSQTFSTPSSTTTLSSHSSSSSAIETDTTTLTYTGSAATTDVITQALAMSLMTPLKQSQTAGKHGSKHSSSMTVIGSTHSCSNSHMNNTDPHPLTQESVNGSTLGDHLDSTCPTTCNTTASLTSITDVIGFSGSAGSSGSNGSSGNSGSTAASKGCNGRCKTVMKLRMEMNVLKSQLSAQEDLLRITAKNEKEENDEKHVKEEEREGERQRQEQKRTCGEDESEEVKKLKLELASMKEKWEESTRLTEINSKEVESLTNQLADARTDVVRLTARLKEVEEEAEELEEKLRKRKEEGLDNDKSVVTELTKADYSSGSGNGGSGEKTAGIRYYAKIEESNAKIRELMAKIRILEERQKETDGKGEGVGKGSNGANGSAPGNGTSMNSIGGGNTSRAEDSKRISDLLTDRAKLLHEKEGWLAERRDLEQKRTELEAKLREERQAVQHAQDEAMEMQKEITEMVRCVREMEEVVREKGEEMEMMAIKNEKLKGEHDKTLSQLKDTVRSLQDQIEAGEKEAMVMSKTIYEVQSEKETMAAELSALKGVLEKKDEEISKSKEEWEGGMRDLQARLEITRKASLDALKARESELRKERDDELTVMRESWEEEVSKLKKEREEEVNALKEELEKVKSRNIVVEREVVTLRDEVKGLNEQLSLAVSEEKLTKNALEHALQTSRETRESVEREVVAERERMSKEMSELKKEVETLKAEAVANDQVRRQLHNELVDLKGNIRVFCRIRPIVNPGSGISSSSNAPMLTSATLTSTSLPSSTNSGPTGPSTSTSSNACVVYQPVRKGPSALTEDLQVRSLDTSITGTLKQTTNTYKFDRVFTAEHTQQQLFEELKCFVTSGLDGYSVSVFAYGQTGSGKTHTMMGPEECVASGITYHSHPNNSNNVTLHAVSNAHTNMNQNVGAQALALSPHRGIIPRAVEQIFAVVNMRQGQSWKYKIRASFVEIYNEQVRDLLSNIEGETATAHPLSLDCLTSLTSNSPTSIITHQTSGGTGPLSITSLSSSSTSDKSEEGCKIVQDKQGRVYVQDLRLVPVDSPDSVYALLAEANASRAVASTASNARSSRSHSVFQLWIVGAYQPPSSTTSSQPSSASSTSPTSLANQGTESNINGAKTTTLASVISLIDLAGSERLDKSKAEGQARKEAQHINTSLSALSHCMDAIASKREHIPYRNSRLTYLLKDSLGGTAKTLFVTNISGDPVHAQESVCTLRFAETLRGVELGPRAQGATSGGGGGGGSGSNSSGHGNASSSTNSISSSNSFSGSSSWMKNKPLNNSNLSLQNKQHNTGFNRH